MKEEKREGGEGRGDCKSTTAEDNKIPVEGVG